MKSINYKMALGYLGVIGSLSLLAACESPKSNTRKATVSSETTESTTEESTGKKIINDRHLRSPLDDFER
ncbi:MAG: hypothetical protein JSS34_08150 [Proteobacteria bacterium]|nr:hypothetical protein [Pseudomonadota bacterium]